MRPLFCLLALAALLPAQIPLVGYVDYYGLRKVPLARAQKALGPLEGRTLPRNKADLEDKLVKELGVSDASITAVCCEQGKTIVYVGVAEKGAKRFELNPEPKADVKLPTEAVELYDKFMESLQEGVKNGITDESMVEGHSLFAYAPAREAQLAFIPLAKERRAILREVLKNAGEPEQRAMAATMIAYGPKTQELADDLQLAVRDPDSGVRNNAMRALAALAIYADKHPDQKLQVQPTWLVEMLSSLEWSDRNKAALTLVPLTETRNELTLKLLRERAMPELLEMARWKNPGHALMAYILAGRAAGIPEQELQDAWEKGAKDAMLKRIEAPAKQ